MATIHLTGSITHDGQEWLIGVYETVPDAQQALGAGEIREGLAKYFLQHASWSCKPFHAEALVPPIGRVVTAVDANALAAARALAAKAPKAKAVRKD